MDPKQLGIPPIGLGTSKLGEATYNAIRTALDVGYTHLDTAQSYDSEETIGRALRDSGTKPADVFITTKVADTNLSDERFMPSVRDSLDKLGTDRVDLLLIHWPSHRDAVPFEHYMASLRAAKDQGYARMVGVSNYPIARLEQAIALLGAGLIVNNQVEVHPYLQNRKLVAWCRDHDILVTAYMPLGKGRILGDPVICGIAQRLGLPPATVVLAWLVQSGMITVPASTRRENLEANLRAADIRLAKEDMAAIHALDRGERFINPAKSPAWD